MVLAKRLVALGTCDGKELCSLAKKVPATLKGVATRPGSAVNKDSLNRGKLVAIIDKPYKRQQYIDDIHSVLYSDDYPMGSDGGDVYYSAEWPDEGCTVVRTNPKAWMSWWLMENYSAKGLTKATMQGLEADDSSNIRTVFSAAIQFPLSTTVLVALHDDGTLAAHVFAARADKCGHVVRKLIETRAISDKGLDYCKYQAYKLEFGEDQRATQVTHSCTCTVVSPPKHVTITNEFEVKDGWYDATASVVLDP